MAKVHTLTDDFATESTAKWSGFGSSIYVSNGQLTLEPTNEYPTLYSQVAYDLTDSSITIELVQAPSQGNGSIEAGVAAQVSIGNSVSFLVTGAVLLMRESVAGANNDTQVTYDSLQHRWLRIREAAGTVYWETSSDATSWTLQRSKVSGLGSLQSIAVVMYAGYWDDEPSPGVVIVDNVNLATLPPVVAEGWVVGRLPFGGGTVATTVNARTYFDVADWLWNPIPDSPVLDPDSAAIVSLLSSTANSARRVANMYEFGITLRGPSGVDETTPRYPITFANVPDWGSDPFQGQTVGIPNGTPIPPGSDGPVAIADPITGKVYAMWQATHTGNTWGATWGAMSDLHGDGLETTSGASTGARISQYAAVIRASEIAAGEIPHALSFSTDIAHGSEFRYPATNSDGSNMAGVAHPIPEGARVQLDPTLDVAAIPGITPAELAVARALQKYGAYCSDNGGSRMAFAFEYQDSNPGQVYVDAGLAWDYFDMTHIPWESLRVLRQWDGE